MTELSWPGSNPAEATSLRNFGNSVYPALSALSEDILKDFGPFYLVSMLDAICGSARSMDRAAQSMDPQIAQEYMDRAG